MESWFPWNSREFPPFNEDRRFLKKVPSEDSMESFLEIHVSTKWCNFLNTKVFHATLIKRNDSNVHLIPCPGPQSMFFILIFEVPLEMEIQSSPENQLHKYLNYSMRLLGFIFNKKVFSTVTGRVFGTWPTYKTKAQTRQGPPWLWNWLRLNYESD